MPHGIILAKLHSFRSMYTSIKAKVFSNVISLKRIMDGCLWSRANFFTSSLQLNPACLLTQNVGDVPDHLPDLGVRDMYRSQWRFAQVLANTFQIRWLHEYLQSMQIKIKRQSKSPDLAEGDTVILKDKEQHSKHWFWVRSNMFSTAKKGWCKK